VIEAALAQRAESGRPIRVGVVGAGFMGRGVVRQLLNAPLPGFRLVAVANRTLAHAEEALRRAGGRAPARASDLEAVATAAESGVPCVTTDATLLCASPHVDVIVEATGAVEFGAKVITTAIAHATDVVSLNVELDATIGALLQERAQAAGVVVTGSDGDQPAVQVNLARFVRTLGLTPLVCGNVKGLQDRYRTPDTQRAYAAQWGQSATMVTSFADGTKISMEQALVANALGMSLAASGMLGPSHAGHVDDLCEYFLREVGLERLHGLGGIVDYVVGAHPSPGVFILAANPDPEREIYLRYGKLGDGPLYSFYVPYHLTALEVPISVARVALLRDHVVTSRVAAPRVEVVARAKRDLPAGTLLDGIGGFCTYGSCERGSVTADYGMLPIGIAEGARLRRAVVRDDVIHYDDVELAERLVVELRREQDARFVADAASERLSEPPR
jgi:predicted homoserine dehydrogenase-like protein